MNVVTTSLASLLEGTPYLSYTYAYPHKTAYRQFAPALRLADVWAQENRAALFLYFHIPFCEMRCGFCNLFTLVNSDNTFEKQYLDALERHAEATHAALGSASVARMALGGGTPTYLDVHALSRVFDLAATFFGVDSKTIPTSVETSPLTAEREKLQLLSERGVSRISMGVQSFVEAEVHAIGRAQKNVQVDTALRNIRDADFPTLNIDLIYGLPGQTLKSWLESLRIALSYMPEELYLYPLYVRPLTGLDRVGLYDPADDIRLACYRAGRDLLLEAGYKQVTMRMFRAPHAPAQDGPVYCVQEDGMVGIGCGARSYTSKHHYCSEYAVSAKGVRAIVTDYIGRSAADFGQVPYGFELNAHEQRRRYVIKSLLEADGLSINAYKNRFSRSIWEDLPQLYELLDTGLATENDGMLCLTGLGLERSDTIGVWLYSPTVQARMQEYELR